MTSVISGGGIGAEMTDGALNVNSLAKDGAVLVGAGTYNANEIKGFLVVAVGTGDWTLVTKEGSTLAFTPTSAYIGQVYPFHLTSLTITASSEVVVFI